jgi:hypothetical protein
MFAQVAGRARRHKILQAIVLRTVQLSGWDKSPASRDQLALH